MFSDLVAFLISPVRFSINVFFMHTWHCPSIYWHSWQLFRCSRTNLQLCAILNSK